ncbi:MAG: 50S ribosomal protein L25 [Dehalococcoidia bacterium]|nr:50S ribosomal protein L25 [Dehalococcoidia bacterium]
MKQEELSASSRGILGKKVRSLRRKGLTPANLYGPNTESIPLQVETPLLERLIVRVGQNAMITLRVDGAPRMVMIRDIQRNPLTDGMLHVSFFQVEMTQKVRAEVPLLFLGEAPAVKSRRWILIQNLTTLQVEALPSELPRNIEVDLSKLEELNRAISVRDLPIGDTLKVLNDPDQVIAHVEGIRIEVEEAKPVEAPPESEM